MKIKNIKYKTGAQIKAAPEKTYNELERIRSENDGDLNGAMIVKESKPKTAVLHGEFEWHNPTAANLYREQQARYIVRSVEVEYEDESPTRAYQSVRVVEQAEPEQPAKAKHVYRTTAEVMADPDTRDELLGQAIRDALAFRKRYQDLQELAKLFVAMDEILMEVQA